MKYECTLHSGSVIEAMAPYVYRDIIIEFSLFFSFPSMVHQIQFQIVIYFIHAAF